MAKLELLSYQVAVSNCAFSMLPHHRDKKEEEELLNIYWAYYSTCIALIYIVYSLIWKTFSMNHVTYSWELIFDYTLGAYGMFFFKYLPMIPTFWYSCFMWNPTFQCGLNQVTCFQQMEYGKVMGVTSEISL